LRIICTCLAGDAKCRVPRLGQRQFCRQAKRPPGPRRAINSSSRGRTRARTAWVPPALLQGRLAAQARASGPIPRAIYSSGRPRQCRLSLVSGPFCRAPASGRGRLSWGIYRGPVRRSPGILGDRWLSTAQIAAGTHTSSPSQIPRSWRRRPRFCGFVGEGPVGGTVVNANAALVRMVDSSR
jgi:hypothetical protein